jgi:hypothetical protein
MLRSGVTTARSSTLGGHTNDRSVVMGQRVRREGTWRPDKGNRRFDPDLTSYGMSAGSRSPAGRHVTIVGWGAT